MAQQRERRFLEENGSPFLFSPFFISCTKQSFFYWRQQRILVTMDEFDSELRTETRLEGKERGGKRIWKQMVPLLTFNRI